MRLTLLSPDLHNVILPQSVISDEKLPAGEDTYVIGCKNIETEKHYGVYGLFL